MTDETTIDADRTEVIRIDIVSDVVCPWCIVGYKQLEHAQAQTGIPVEIHWHPFELNPDMPDEGQNLREHIAAKYGTSPEDSVKARQRLTDLGANLGFDFRYADDMRMVNTFRAHQTIHWAGTQGDGHQGGAHDMKMALFAAFFTRREDLNDPEVLANVAGEAGFERDAAAAMLAEERFSHTVRQAEHMWLARGIQGVPGMVFQQKYLVTGAQGIENYAAILTQVSQDAAA